MSSSPQAPFLMRAHQFVGQSPVENVHKSPADPIAHFLFLHKIQFPFRPDFSNPVRYGIAPYKARNLRISTSDNIKIGAWHVLPDVYMQKTGPGPYSTSQYDQALRDYPTVIYLHGNAANRAAPFRTATYSQITSRLDSNVIAIDYRGFGDSDGFPNEQGLVLDAQAAWSWLAERRAGGSGRYGHAALQSQGQQGAGVVVMGQSLGTGVASQVTLELTEKGSPPQGLVLIAPYSSLRELITSYRIGGFIPPFGPLELLPGSKHFLDRVLHTQFNTSAVLPALFTAAEQLPGTAFPKVVINHATDDDIIPFKHAEDLFETLLVRELGELYPPDPFHGNLNKAMNANQAGDRVVEKLTKWKEDRERARASVARKQVIEGFCTVETMPVRRGGAAAQGQSGKEKAEDLPSISLIRTTHGGHNKVGEGVIDLVGQITGILQA